MSCEENLNNFYIQEKVELSRITPQNRMIANKWRFQNHRLKWDTRRYPIRTRNVKTQAPYSLAMLMYRLDDFQRYQKVFPCKLLLGEQNRCFSYSMGPQGYMSKWNKSYQNIYIAWLGLSLATDTVRTNFCLRLSTTSSQVKMLFLKGFYPELSITLLFWNIYKWNNYRFSESVVYRILIFNISKSLTEHLLFPIMRISWLNKLFSSFICRELLT